jgi:YVTN family beta-propeller protein
VSRLVATLLVAVISAPLAGAAGRGVRSSSLAVTPDGALLLVASPDSHSLTLLATADLGVLAEVPVGRSPRAVAVDGEGRLAFVTGRDDDSLTAVDLSSWRVVGRRSVPRQPAGVVVAGDRVLVAAAGADRVATFDAATLEASAEVATDPAPHGLALSGDARTLLVTHFGSGRLSVLDVEPLTVRRTTGTTLDANLAAAVAIDEASGLAFLPATRANASSPALVFDNTLLPIVAVVDPDEGRELVDRRIALDLADRPVSRPRDALLVGGRLWVVHAGSGDLSVIDLGTGSAVAHLELGEEPSGLALAPGGDTVYVHHALDGTVAAIDVATLAVRHVAAVTRSPLPAAVQHGKVLFHTSRPATVARDRWISCAGCHPEGGGDGRTWAFPDGPRNTPSLHGVRDTLPLHWSGDLDELQDVESTIRTLQAGTGLARGDDGCEPACDRAPPNAGRSAELDDLAAFMRSLRPRPSPHLVDGSLSAAALRGQAVFARTETGCAGCHPEPAYTDRRRHDVGTGGGAGERKGPHFDTPSLRSLHETAPYLHDGRAVSLHEVLTTHNPGDRHGRTSQLRAEEVDDLVAFLRSLPFARGSDECQEDGETLCLRAGALRARATFVDPRDGATHRAHAVRLSDGGGGFSFFDSAALDLALKAIDGRPLTTTFWVFAGSLTSVDWKLTVEAPASGRSRTFRAARPSCGDVDMASLPVAAAAPAAGGGGGGGHGAVAATLPSTPTSSPAGTTIGCAPSPTALCLLGDRFRVEARWTNPRGGTSGTARALPLLADSGLFSFFDRDNPEVAVKLLDGRGVNGGFWFFDGRLTDLGYELVVTDTATGQHRVYPRPAGQRCGGVDLAAFIAEPTPTRDEE